MTWLLRYSVVSNGVIVDRRNLKFKAAKADALRIGASWLCICDLGFTARITSLRRIKP